MKHRRHLVASAALLVLAGSANAATQIVWRSATTGTIQTAAPTTPTNPNGPTAPNTDPLSVWYAPNDRNEVRGQPISITPAILNGTGPYAFSVVDGALPTGYAIDAATGKIVGIAVNGGNYTATLKVVDSTGKALQFKIAFQID